MSAICRAVFYSGIVLATCAVNAQSKGDAARGAAKAEACGSCHGTSDRAALPGTPSLAGQQQEFLVLQMFLFREGLRDVPQMAGMFKGITDRDFSDMAAYFAAQSSPRSNGKPDPKLRARGAEIAKAMGCGSCHLQNYGGQRQVPRLVNQREDYLVASMKAYRDNQRAGTDTSMNAVLYQVTDHDIQALAHYLAHQ
jgi:cytochrome c553